eukprot:GFUD01039211.1.p1 GENE.GFUD01039211.1~~GFUD01039211.1.p1  ORF type:complete len:326 (+),score=137.99 GFUD01039211.1:96-980(+)
MKFVVILCLAISTNAMPQMGNTNQTGSDQTWSDWAKEQQDQVANTYGEGKDQIMQGWEWLQEFLPRRVGSYLEDTADGGQKVFEDIWEETRKSIVEKTSGNVDDITGLVETFIDKLENVRANAVDIVFQEEPLSSQQIQAKNVQEDLEGIKKELTGLNEEIAKDQKEDKKFENFGWDDPKIDNCQVLEGMIQRLITSAREVLTEANNQTDLFWSKVKQLEVETYRVNRVMAQSSGNLKDVLKELFKTLSKELKEASPALKEILDKVEQEEAAVDGAQEAIKKAIKKKQNTPRQG